VRATVPLCHAKLLDDDALERSGVVANCQMNRERTITGSNGYAKELRLNPVDFLLGRSGARVRWLDLCCGEGKALVEAAKIIHRQGMDHKFEILGVDIVAPPSPSEREAACLQLIQASLTQWQPEGRFDLITCVHGLHYIGDKLGVVLRAASWLTDDGRFVANLDLNNIKFADGRVASGIVAKELRRAGLEYDSRRKLVHCSGRIQVQLPFRYCGADDQAGPNYTKQPAVDSYYE
jgi:SAM-dependent methyltransferase